MNNSLINILIVEDEMLLLRNMKKKITELSEGFQIIGETFNGKDALAMMETRIPDIIITDIRMPIMNGLDLVKIVHEKYPEVHAVIVTGYDDFEYAHTALRYHVHDYLLKPLKIEELRKTLCTLKMKILKQRQEKLQSALSCLLNEPFSDTALQQASLREYAEMDAECFSCFLICFGNLYLHEQDFTKSVEQPECLHSICWPSALESASFSVSDFQALPLRPRNVWLLLLKGLNADPGQAGRYIHAYFTRSMPQISINLIHGDGFISLAQLHTQLLSLNAKLFSSFVPGRSAVLPLAGTAALPPASLPSATGRQLHSLLSSKDAAGFVKIMAHLLSEWDKQQYSLQWVEKILLQIFSILQQTLSFSDQEYEQMQNRIFFHLETCSRISESIEPINAEFRHIMLSKQDLPSDMKDVIDEMESYIRLHYRESITISDLAEKYHFNHSYLTRVFKKQKGISPLKLINRLRICDAEKLLSDSSLSIREISEMLGFSEQHYFSRIFKDFTGQTPKEYRCRE